MKNRVNLVDNGLYTTIFWLPFINIITYIGMLVSFFSSPGKSKLLTKKNRLDYTIMLFVVMIFLSVLTSMNKMLSIYGFIAFIAYPIAYFIFANNLSEENLSKILKLIMISSSIVIIFGVVQPLLPNSILYRNDALFINLQTWEGKGMATSTLGHPNALAGYLVLILPLIACFFIQKPSLKMGIIFILGLACLILTSSRAAWIGFGVGFLVLLITKKKKILLLMLLVFLIPFFTLPALNIHLKSVLDASTYGERLTAWRTSLNIVRHYPLTGTGINTFYELYPRFRLPESGTMERICHAHNVFLHLGAETGLLGTGAFCVLLILFFNMSWKVYRTASAIPDGNSHQWIVLGLMAGAAGFIVHNLGDYLFSHSQIGILFWIMMGIMRGLERIQTIE